MLSTLILATFALAAPGHRIEMEMLHAGKPPLPLVIHITKDFLRFGSSAAAHEGARMMGMGDTLYVLSEDRAYSINDEKKTYFISNDREKNAQMKAAMAQMRKTMAQVSGMSQQMKEQMAKFGDTKKEAERDILKELEKAPILSTGTVAGFACDIKKLSGRGNITEEYCVAKDMMGPPAHYLPVIEGFMKLMSDMLGAFVDKSLFPKPKAPNGKTSRTAILSVKGNDGSGYMLKKLEAKEIDPALGKVPAAYRVDDPMAKMRAFMGNPGAAKPGK